MGKKHWIKSIWEAQCQVSGGGAGEGICSVYPLNSKCENAAYSIKWAMWPWSTGLHWAAVQQDDISKPICTSPPWWRRSSHRSCTGRRRCRWGMGCPSLRWSGGGWWSAGSCHSAASSSDLQVGGDSSPHGETRRRTDRHGEKSGEKH